MAQAIEEIYLRKLYLFKKIIYIYHIYYIMLYYISIFSHSKNIYLFNVKICILTCK